MKLLKRITFTSVGILLAVLVAATLLEKIYGTETIHARIYSSVSFVLLWLAVTVLSSWYILKRKLYRQFTPFLLHLSFVVILAGAFTTWLTGEQGRIDLQYGTSEQTFADRKGHVYRLPFEISLDKFETFYYEGTFAPMDYVSSIRIQDADRTILGKVSMNRIFSYRQYRFYQSGYDADGKGTILSVSHDPWGIGITYTGYALLLLSMILFFLKPGNRFRELVESERRHSKAALAAVLIGLTGLSLPADAATGDRPETFPRASAEKLGNLYMLYNNRICPVQTFAKDFTVKMYGKPTYRGLTPEQVLTGWLFYYDSWEREPFIRIKSREARRILEIQGKYASLSDYFGQRGTFKIDPVLDSLMTGQREGDKRGLEETNEKLNIISMVCAGTLLKIYPHTTEKAAGMTWYAQNSKLPKDLDHEEWLFIRKSMDYVYELALHQDFEAVDALLEKIRLYQKKALGENGLPETRFKAEKAYNDIDCTKILAMICTALGILAFLYFCYSLATGRQTGRRIRLFMNVLLLLLFAYMTVLIVLRWIASGHVPLSNGYETMHFLAWVTLLLTLLFQKRFHMVLPFGCLLCGLSLMVSMMGGSNPQITQLMPVLSSPLLSIHVMVIMIAYSLLAFTMLNGITALVLHAGRQDRTAEILHLKNVSEILLYPAIFLLAIGIFIGALWANVSWGRYWGWDPKETWALITMLIYSLALHSGSLPKFRNPVFFHTFCLLAFLSVLITYFGVNFLLGGMHSYA